MELDLASTSEQFAPYPIHCKTILTKTFETKQNSKVQHYRDTEGRSPPFPFALRKAEIIASTSHDPNGIISIPLSNLIFLGFSVGLRRHTFLLDGGERI